MADARNYLALDVATNTGWAWGSADAPPKFGSIRFGSPGASHPAILEAAMTWVGSFCHVNRVDALAIEAPLNPGFARSNINTVRLLMGLASVMEATAYKFGVWKIEEARVQAVRKHFLGQGNIPGGQAKKLVMKKCRELGLMPRNDNEGDALALFYWATKQHGHSLV